MFTALISVIFSLLNYILMQTNTFIQSQELLVKELRLDDLSAVLSRLLLLPVTPIKSDEKSKIVDLLWDIRKKIEELQNDPKVSFLLTDLQINDELTREIILEILTVLQNSDSPAPLRNSHNFYKYLKIKGWVDALRREAFVTKKYLFHPLEIDTSDFRIVSFEILVDDDKGLQFDRFSLILNDLSDLFYHVSAIYNKPLEKSTITFIESGSDILVAIKAVKETAEFIIGALQFYYKYLRNLEYLTAEKQSSALQAQLAVNKEIHEQAKLGYIDLDRAKLLSNSIITSIGNLMDNEVVLAEYHTDGESPKGLLTEGVMKLLSEGEVESNEGDSSLPKNDNNNSDEKALEL